MVFQQILHHAFFAGFGLLVLSFFFYRVCNRLWASSANLIRGMQIILAMAILILHGLMTLGPWNILIFILVSAGIGTGSEYLGITYGWPFGRYQYSDRVGPKIMGIPIAISLLWCSVAYMAFWQSYVLVCRIHICGEQALCLITLFTPLFVTILDLVTDPIASDEGLWVWQQKGRYAGIPLSNYVGWFGAGAFIVLVLHSIFQRPVFLTPLSPIMACAPAFGYCILFAASTRVCFERKLILPGIIGLIATPLLALFNFYYLYWAPAG
jgi:uncharacterized membrane protein